MIGGSARVSIDLRAPAGVELESKIVGLEREKLME